MREYQRLAQSMIARQPGELRYRLERSYANNNLGVLVLEQRRYREASRILGSELADSEALLASDPGSAAYQDRLLEALAWLSDVREKTGELEDAIGQRERQISLLRQSMTSRGDDTGLQRKLMTRRNGSWDGCSHREEMFRAGLSTCETRLRSAKSFWRQSPATRNGSNISLMEFWSSGSCNWPCASWTTPARPLVPAVTWRTGLQPADSSVSMWRVDLPVRCFELRARLALARSEPAEAQALSANLSGLMQAERSKAKSPDDRIDLAIAHMLRGDVASRLGDSAGARAAWQSGLSAWPKGVELQPRELALYASLLRKTGQVSNPWRSHGS